MSLILPGSPCFANVTDVFTGTPVAAVGVNFTAAANNVMGTAVSVLAAIPHDVHYLVIGLGGFSGSADNSQVLADILIDAAGGSSWSATPLIDKLICGFTSIPGAGGGMPLYYHFPVYVKSGASLGVQAQTSWTANITTGRIAIWAFGNPKRPDMWWCGSKVESLGINSSVSQGTDVTGGNTGAFGSWTAIGTSTGRYGALQLGLNGSDATATGTTYHWQIGAGSSQLAGIPTFHSAMANTEVQGRTGWGIPLWCDVPSGTELQVRGTASGTAETQNLAIYGVY